MGGSARLLFDGAHNPAGAKVLREFFRRIHHNAIHTCLRRNGGQEARANGFSSLPRPAARLILVEPDNPRAAKLEMLNSLAKRFAEA